MNPYRRPATAQSRVADSPTRGLWPAFLAVAAGSVAFTMCTARAEPSELDGLSPDERAAVIARTLANLELCERERPADLREFCEAEAARAERAGVPVGHRLSGTWRSRGH